MRIEAEQAKDTLYELLGKLEYGQEQQIIITKRGLPVAKLVDYYGSPYATKTGVAKGKINVPSEEEWKAMDEEIDQMFEESIARGI